MGERILLGVVVAIAIGMSSLFVANRKGSPADIAAQSLGVMILSFLLLLFVIVAAVILYGGVIGSLG